MSGFGGMLLGGDLFGAGQESGAPGPSSPQIDNVSPSVGPSGLPLGTALSFDVIAASAIQAIGVAVLYLSTKEYFMAYEVDAFTPDYAAVSSIGGVGTNTVSLTLFEFGGWRERVRSILVFGIDAGPTKFVLEVLE